eukprot:Phypoly_transcript_07488.p1 GENE.Phypoly_transcript_07488~~Phypoly_transcript_07488.p1  ORF type:complete len:413 (+),score=76.56 Phypoly_transcript_07488:369-1607(+)
MVESSDPSTSPPSSPTSSTTPPSPSIPSAPPSPPSAPFEPDIKLKIVAISVLVLLAAFLLHMRWSFSDGPPHYSVTISPTPTEADQIRELLLKIQPPIFPGIVDKDKIKLEQFHNATSNRVFKCSYKKTSVMIRIHGEGSSKLVDRAQELKFARDLGTMVRTPFQIYCTFNNGFVAKYLEAHGITLSEMSGSLAEEIADVFADWHKVRTHLNPFKRGTERGIWKTLDDWIIVAKSVVPTEELSPVLEEIEYMKQFIWQNHNIDIEPLALCHNDLNVANILYNENAKKSQRVLFIDYEYSGWNYAAYDLGNHFCEYAGVGDIDFSRYPNEETRKAFLRRYLLSLTPKENVTEKQLQDFVEEVEHYAQVSHLVWHLWALVISHTSQHTEGFDYKAYAKIRMEEYLKRKEVLEND